MRTIGSDGRQDEFEIFLNNLDVAFSVPNRPEERSNEVSAFGSGKTGIARSEKTDPLPLAQDDTE
jgi:hypothetical protein